ncbi:MAG TPA: hypothetical protein DIT09_15565 [Glutamicibacter sp.]|uniref:restriction endonuclease subunit S n=1 Tax=Glutamicibacter arilaitensis TaxID=256701 RepID=UPI000EE9507E|nr:hypothetical protein [Glutamicibacter sp.]
MDKWNVARIGDIAEVKGGKRLPKGTTLEARNNGAPYIRITDWADGAIDAKNMMYVPEAAQPVISRYRIHEDDIFISIVGTIGLTARIGADLDGSFLTENAAKITVTNKIMSSTFLRYALMSSAGQNEIHSLAVGSTQPKLALHRIRDIKVPCPSREVQVAISDVLGALDEKIATNTSISRSADQLAGHLFDQAASSVPTIPMSKVLTPILGGTPARANPNFWNGERLWASAKDITGSPFAVLIDSEEKITTQAIERTKAKPLPAGSVILTARGTVGAVARLAVPSSFNQSCYGFIPNELPPGLLYFSILRAAQRAKSLAHGSVFDTITMRTFDHLLMPDFGEARVSIESQIAPLLDLVTTKVLENASLAAIRDALLPQLMSGKLRVTEAEALIETVL